MQDVKDTNLVFNKIELKIERYVLKGNSYFLLLSELSISVLEYLWRENQNKFQVIEIDNVIQSSRWNIYLNYHQGSG